MIHNLNEFEKLKVTRQIIGNCKYDKYSMPIIRKIDIDSINWNNLSVIGLQNATAKKAEKSKLILMFNYDKLLMSLWNSPLKKIAMFRTYGAVATPDFSNYPTMNPNEVRHNVYMSRWLGVLWQNYGCVVLPTVGWALPETYDISFSGIEYGSVVVISTIGCQKDTKIFLDGFNELKRRINPPLIVVFGHMIEGMTGVFVQYSYDETFNKAFEQLRITEIPRIFTIKGD